MPAGSQARQEAHAIPSFEDELTATAARVDNALDSILPRKDGTDRLSEAMRYAVLGGGKRLRPFLLVCSATLFEVTAEDAIRAACAVECVHAYSLIHDDLPAMDNDDLRRGRPTVHRAFDEATAILAGDGLLTFAFEVMADPANHPDPGIRAELVLGLARAAGPAGMAGGQMRDLQAQTVPLDEPAIRRMQAMKTGALIAFACEAGAILGLARADDRRRLACFGEQIGLAFQIADDLLDEEASAEQLGKATGKDRQSGKATLVGIHGLEQTRDMLCALVSDAVRLLAPFGPRAAMLRDAASFIAHRQA